LKRNSKEENQVLTNDTIQTLLTRRSIKIYKEDQVPEEELLTILEAAKFAPSGMGLQEWHFTAVQNKDELRALNDAAKQVLLNLPEDDSVPKPLKNQAKHYKDKPDFNFFYNAPTLVIVTSSKDPATSSPAADCAAALENIFVAANSLGVSSCWINLLTRMSDFPEIRNLFTKWGIPKNERCYGSAALGYNGGPEKKAAPRREGTVILVK
jgi:nitroreductase